MLRIPSISQVIQDQLIPKSWRSVHLEHQIVKTAENVQELVTLNRGLLEAQVVSAGTTNLTSIKSAATTSLTREQLAGIRDEVAAVNTTLRQYGDESLQRFRDIHRGMSAGFATVANLLAQITANQKQQIASLNGISEILSKPYETQQKELYRRADALLTHALRHPDRNQASNLDDSLALFNQVIANPVGKHDYLAWFHIGWLNWRFTGDLPKATSAFSHAQRSSAVVGEPDFYVKSLRHLAHVQMLLRDHLGACNTIEEAIRVETRGDTDAAIFYESALYSALQGDIARARSRLRPALQLDPVLFDRLLTDADFRRVSGWNDLVCEEMNHELALATSMVKKLLLFLEALPHNDPCASISKHWTEIANTLTGRGFISLRQLRREAESDYALAERQFSILQTKREEIASKRDEIASEKEKIAELEKLRAAITVRESKFWVDFDRLTPPGSFAARFLFGIPLLFGLIVGINSGFWPALGTIFLGFILILGLLFAVVEAHDFLYRVNSGENWEDLQSQHSALNREIEAHEKKCSSLGAQLWDLERQFRAGDKELSIKGNRG